MSSKTRGHVPMRTCAACLKKFPKQELFRTVCDDNGHLHPDPEQRLPGRGSYVCKNKECLDNAVLKNGFDRAFRRQIDRQSAKNLLKEKYDE